MSKNGTLLLDGQTLINLEILQNSVDGSETGTLLHLLNHAITPFGKRLFKKWLCHPLRSVHHINERLDAVQDFLNHSYVQVEIRKHFESLPDLERIVSRIQAKACKLSDFLKALDGFSACLVN